LKYKGKKKRKKSHFRIVNMSTTPLMVTLVGILVSLMDVTYYGGKQLMTVTDAGNYGGKQP